MTAALAIRVLGRMDYREALALQRELAEARRAGRGEDTLLLVEPPSVFTPGRRRGATANVLAAGDTPVLEIEPGGDVNLARSRAAMRRDCAMLRMPLRLVALLSPACLHDKTAGQTSGPSVDTVSSTGIRR